MKLMKLFILLTVCALLVSVAGCLGNDLGPNAATGSNTSASAATVKEMQKTLSEVSTTIQDHLTTMDQETSEASVALSTLPLDGDGAGMILSGLVSSDASVVNAVTENTIPVIINAEPESSSFIIGKDLSEVPGYASRISVPGPDLSATFMLEQGVPGAVISFPIYQENGTLRGLVETAFVPDHLIGPIAEKATAGTSYEIWVTQTDGTQIYDANVEEVYRNLFSDIAYQEETVQAMAKQVTTEPEGMTSYTYWNEEMNKIVTKFVVWNTVGLHETDWRVALAKPVE